MSFDIPAGARSRARLDPPLHWDVALFVCLPAVLTVCLVVVLGQAHQLAFDFRREYWVAGARLLDGTPLYAWSHAQIASNIAFPYPPLTALIFAPASVLPAPVASAIACLACAACAIGALRLLCVRDWRLYGLVLLWGPVVAGWQSANLSLPFVLALALIWRYRDRPLLIGLIGGLLMALKPFAWPVVLWLLVTRRRRATLVSAAAAALSSAVAFALIGFSQLHAFLKLDGTVTSGALHKSYSVVGLCLGLGTSRTVAYAVFALLIGLLVAALVIAGRRDDRLAMLICVLLMLAASPLVWTHYLTLLIVPLAIMRPRLSVEWIAPLLLWVCPEAATSTLQIVIAWIVVSAIAIRLMPGGRGRVSAVSTAVGPHRY